MLILTKPDAVEDFTNPRPGIKDAEMIVNQLCRIQRWNGMGNIEAPVLYHCSLTVAIARTLVRLGFGVPTPFATFRLSADEALELEIYCALHDVEETIFGDIPQPILEFLKVKCHDFTNLRYRWRRVLLEQFNVPMFLRPLHHAIFKLAHEYATILEAEMLGITAPIFETKSLPEWLDADFFHTHYNAGKAGALIMWREKTC